jgi:hypothetical protein
MSQLARKVLVTGACTAPGIAMGLQLLMPQCEVQTMYVHEVLAEGGAERLETALGSVDRRILPRVSRVFRTPRSPSTPFIPTK